MGRPLSTLKKPTISTKRAGKMTLKNEKVYNTHIVSAVKKRLKMTTKEMPAHVVQKYMRYIGKEVMNWIIDNPEGFRMPYDMGFLATSKFVMIPFDDNRFYFIKKFTTREDIAEEFRKKMLRKYGRKLKYYELLKFIQKGKISTRGMWFNKKNCSFKKSMVWTWEPSKYYRREIKKTDRTKFFFFKAHDFYDHRIKVMDKF